jgi:hypothetical protein
MLVRAGRPILERDGMARALVAALLMTPALAGGQAAAPQAPPPGQVTALPLPGPVAVDGILDEAAWGRAPTLGRLTQRDPIEGAAPSESTDIWVAYDDEALYVAARCWDACPDSIIAQLVRRDVSVASDRFMLYLDPFHDRRSGYYFGVNAAGVLYDGTLFNDSWDDSSWDAVWSGGARRDARGWTVEMRVPFSQLRFRSGSDQVWGINFRRRIERYSEEDLLVFTPRKESGFVSRFPDLVGIRNDHHARRVEIMPYLTGKAEYLMHEPGDPFHDGSQHTPGAGADLRTSMGNNLTLNVTVNPDFGQVEVDPAVVNLSDDESYFQEKRPFFTENSRIFSFGYEGAEDYWGFNWPDPTFFYTRRIGRAPQGEAPAADFVDRPLATRILGAAKLTGKLGPRVNFGTLHAVTAREHVDLDTGGVRSEADIEPLTYYGVARGLKEFEGQRHGLGAMATWVQRRFGDDGLRDQLNRQSGMLGLDGWHFLDRGKAWVLSGFAGMSHVTGTAARLVDLQRSSRRYMQRPDVGHLGVDSSATSLTGYGARVCLNRQRGNFFSNSAVGFMTPDFEVHDLGFQYYSDILNGHVGGGWRWVEPNTWRKNMHLLGAWFRSYDFGGHKISDGLFGSASFEFANNYSLRADVMLNPETLNGRRTRGGPLMLNRRGGWGRLHFDTDSKSRLFYYVDATAELQPAANTHAWTLYPGVEWKPMSNFTMSVGPGFEVNREDAQYVTQVLDPGNVPADFGDRRYVFALLDQKTLSANLRLNVSFTPNMSLQAYVQPLVSAADYTGFKELAHSRSYDFVRYGVDRGSTYDPASGRVDPDGGGPAAAFELDDPSFNYKSLRGNVVLRWEYRPGSVFYLVWTQQRTDEEPTGEMRFGPSLERLAKAPADDVVMAKLTYYFGL